MKDAVDEDELFLREITMIDRSEREQFEKLNDQFVIGLSIFVVMRFLTFDLIGSFRWRIKRLNTLDNARLLNNLSPTLSVVKRVEPRVLYKASR